MDFETAAQAIDCDGSENKDSTQAAATATTSDVNAQADLPQAALNAGAEGVTPTTQQAAQSDEQSASSASLASQQLACGLLQLFEPPVDKVRAQLKELINKQNKIYVDLSAEKFKLENVELQEMMDDVKIYREKLVKIKKQMHQIHQRTQSLKKRAQNIETCKQKELQRKLQKQQQEEALIGNK